MKNYIIAWKAPSVAGFVANTVFGLRKYPSQEMAWAQIAIFQKYFRNRYYVIPV
jgi:hypothetical protein